MLWDRFRYKDKPVRQLILDTVKYALVGINYKPMDLSEESVFIVFSKEFIQNYNNIKKEHRLTVLELLFECTMPDKSYSYHRVDDLEECHFNRPFVVEIASNDEHITYELIGLKDRTLPELRKFVKNNFTKYRLSMRESEIWIPGKVPVLRIEKSDMTFITLLDKRIGRDTLIYKGDDW